MQSVLLYWGQPIMISQSIITCTCTTASAELSELVEPSDYGSYLAENLTSQRVGLQYDCVQDALVRGTSSLPVMQTVATSLYYPLAYNVLVGSRRHQHGVYNLIICILTNIVWCPQRP